MLQEMNLTPLHSIAGIQRVGCTARLGQAAWREEELVERFGLNDLLEQLNKS